MKKKIILLLIISLFILTSCKKKDYKLIELTSSDLLTILNENNDSFVYATINIRGNKEESKEFKKALSDYATKGKTNIYYVDTSDLIFYDDEMIYNMTNIDLSKNYLYIVKNGSIKASIPYKGKDTPKTYLSGIHFDKLNIPTSDKEKEKIFAEAKIKYEEGLICSSYTLLQKAWTLDSVKKYYESHDYYKLINYWRSYLHLGDGKVLSKELVIFSFDDTVNSYKYSGLNKNYKYPKSNDYDMKNFYVKDNTIYTADTSVEDLTKYKKQYEILEIKEDYLKIKEKDTIYELFPFSYEGITEETKE